MSASSVLYRSIVKTIHALPVPVRNGVIKALRSSNIPNAKFFSDLKYTGPFNVQLGNASFRMNSTGGNQENTIFWKGLDKADEPETVEVIYKLRSLLDVVIDIGANTGIYCLLAKALNPHAKVYAFEPSRGTYDELITNVKLNGFEIQCEKMALSDQIGEFTFYDSSIPHQTSASLSARMHKVNPSLKDNLFPYPVAVETLDHYISKQQLQKISLIKIDVELHEPEVFRGMKMTLSTYKPMLIFECLFQDVANELEAILKEHAYTLYHLEGKTDFKLVKVDHLTGLLNKDWNYFACHADQAAEVERLCAL